MFPPAEFPPPSQLLLVSDTLASPAEFLIYHFIFESLRPATKKPCIWLGASLNAKRLATVGTKASMNISRALQEGSLILDDFLPDLDLPDALQKIHERLMARLSGLTLAGPPLVILDDLASLSWTHFSTLELFRFARALCAVARQYQAMLIIRYHSVAPDEPEELLKHLMQLCAYHLEVRPLASGRSGAVSGEVALHAGPANFAAHPKLRTRREAIQYRLTDTGASYFERGTGSGVL